MSSTLTPPGTPTPGALGPEPWPAVVELHSPAAVDPALEPVPNLEPAPATTSLPDQVKRHVIQGTSALGASVALERGTGFLANILAARLGGPSTYGSYALAITTANQISQYASCGIGATTVRFSGKYPQGSPAYPSLLKALSVLSLVSAVIAAAGLWLGAGPIAHLLGKESLATLLRCAWISGAGVVLLECARGFFVGQRYVVALLSMSVMVGAGMIFLVPYAAHRHSPVLMVEMQGCVAMAAVLFAFGFGRQLGWRKRADTQPSKTSFLPLLREIWSFGLVQLAGMVGYSLAGWWTTALVARADSTMVEMGFFSIASQLRNIVSLPPSLLAEGSYAVMADPTHEAAQTPQRVMALCCFAALGLSVLFGSLGILITPWALEHLWGRTYVNAGAAVAMGLATAVAHMGFAPAFNRLAIVSIRATAVINTVWAALVAAASSLILLHGGDAWQAMAIYFGAHLISAFLMLFFLRQQDHLPRGLISMFAVGSGGILLLASLSLWRGRHPHPLLTTAVMAGITIVLIGVLLLFGRQHHWLPPRSFFVRQLARLQTALRPEPRHV